MYSQNEINQFDESGKRHGIWRKHHPESEQIRYEGRFEHGKEIGEFKFYCEDCKSNPSIIISYERENPVNLIQYYDRKGNLIKKGYLKNKEQTGTWKTFDPKTKKIISEEEFSKNKKNGISINYYSNGKILEKISYINNERNGEYCLYSPEGVLLEKLYYKNDMLHGSAFYYNGKEQLIAEGFYKENKKDGLWKYYEDGKLIIEEKYPTTVQSKYPFE